MLSNGNRYNEKSNVVGGLGARKVTNQHELKRKDSLNERKIESSALVKKSTVEKKPTKTSNNEIGTRLVKNLSGTANFSNNPKDAKNEFKIPTTQAVSNDDHVVSVYSQFKIKNDVLASVGSKTEIKRVSSSLIKNPNNVQTTTSTDHEQLAKTQEERKRNDLTNNIDHVGSDKININPTQIQYENSPKKKSNNNQIIEVQSGSNYQIKLETNQMINGKNSNVIRGVQNQSEAQNDYTTFIKRQNNTQETWTQNNESYKNRSNTPNIVTRSMQTPVVQNHQTFYNIPEREANQLPIQIQLYQPQGSSFKVINRIDSKNTTGGLTELFIIKLLKFPIC